MLHVYLLGFFSGDGVPESDGLIVAAGDQSTTVGSMEENLFHAARVTLERNLPKK